MGELNSLISELLFNSLDFYLQLNRASRLDFPLLKVDINIFLLQGTPSSPLYQLMFPAERPAVSVIVEKLQHVVANVITGVGCQSHRHWLAGLLACWLLHIIQIHRQCLAYVFLHHKSVDVNLDNEYGEVR